jgi:hypothetical protein
VIRAFAHDLIYPWLWGNFRYRKFINRSCRCYHCPSRRGWNAYKLLIDFTMEKPMMKSWDISREILDTGRLVLNENRSEITFRIKPSQTLSK